MNNAQVHLSPKSDSSKEDEIIKLLYQNAPHPQRDKSSGLTSDDDTNSSSLLPIPETLRQMRCELKRTVSEIGESSESSFTVCGVLQDSKGITQNPFDELRKKYTLKNESSVAFKMNSANLMLDEILKSNNLNISQNEIIPSKFLEQDFKMKPLQESETSTTDSVSFTPNCNHVAVGHLGHVFSPMPCNFSQPICPSHDPPFLHSNLRVCGCTKSLLKSDKMNIDSREVRENSEESLRKKSLSDKLQNIQLKYRIQSMYKTIQKTNPFGRERRKSDSVAVQQGIPDTNNREDSTSSDEVSCHCGSNGYHEENYPKRRMCDLIESSDSSRSDCKNACRIHSKDANCICSKSSICSCPEVLPKCYCHESEELICENSLKENPQGFPKKNYESIPIHSNGTSFTQETRKERRNSCSRERRLVARTDIYYFDHGNCAYYRTTDDHPVRYTECLVKRTDECATKFWAEIFGVLEIGIAFLVSFLLQFYRFLFTSIIRSLIVGFLQISTDYFFKPLLSIFFNGIIQPCLILAYNIATSFRDLCLPISQIFGFFAKEVAHIFRAVRLVEVNYDSCKQSSCNCRNKV